MTPNTQLVVIETSHFTTYLRVYNVKPQDELLLTNIILVTVNLQSPFSSKVKTVPLKTSPLLLVAVLNGSYLVVEGKRVIPPSSIYH